MTNLVSNAIKFTETGTVQLAFLRRADRLIIRVADTGIGIAQAKQAQIFDDFFQVDSTSTRQYEGAGLGLAIVRRLTLLMQGSIELESTVGQGSIFTVDLPLQLPRSGSNNHPTSAEHPFGEQQNGHGPAEVPVLGQAS